MYRSSVSSLWQTAALGLLLFVLQLQSAASRSVPNAVQDADTASNLLRWVSARDGSWSPVLNERLTVDRDALDPYAARMLVDAGIEGPVLKAYQVVYHLVTHPGATGSELDFGVRTLGAALSCQITKTVAVHTFFTLEYAKRPAVIVPYVRWCMSKIQMALPGYLNKLSAFDESIGHLIKFNEHMDAAFESHDTNNAVDKAEFVAHLANALALAKEYLGARCGGNATEREIVKTVRVSSLNEGIFDNRKKVSEDQLLEMIEHLNEYRYVDVMTSKRDTEFWTDRLRIKEFKVKIPGMTPATGSNDKKE